MPRLPLCAARLFRPRLALGVGSAERRGERALLRAARRRFHATRRCTRRQANGRHFGLLSEEADERLARCKGVIASFSRALTEGLSADQSDDEFNQTLDQSIASIYNASIT